MTEDHFTEIVEERKRRAAFASHKRIAELKAALKPLANIHIGVSMNDNATAAVEILRRSDNASVITAGDVRRARAVLKDEGEQDTFERLDSIAARVVSKVGGGE